MIATPLSLACLLQDFNNTNLKQEVRFWIGGSDKITPPQMGINATRDIKNKNIHIYQHEGHISLPKKYFKDIIER